MMAPTRTHRGVHHLALGGRLFTVTLLYSFLPDAEGDAELAAAQEELLGFLNAHAAALLECCGRSPDKASNSALAPVPPAQAATVEALLADGVACKGARTACVLTVRPHKALFAVLSMVGGSGFAPQSPSCEIIARSSSIASRQQATLRALGWQPGAKKQ